MGYFGVRHPALPAAWDSLLLQGASRMEGDPLVQDFLPGALLPSHNNSPRSCLQTGRRWGPPMGTPSPCKVAAGRLLPSRTHAGPHPSHGNPSCWPHARGRAGAGGCTTAPCAPGEGCWGWRAGRGEGSEDGPGNGGSANGTSLWWQGGHPSGCGSLRGPGGESCCWYLLADNFPAPPTAVRPLGLHKKKKK